MKPQDIKEMDKEDNKYLKLLFGGFLLFIVLIIMPKAYLEKHQPKISNGQITRSYTNLLSFLDEEPEDITAIPYEENIPDIIKKDIEKMFTYKEDLEIYYSNDDSSYIRIIKDNKAVNNICMIIYTPNVYLEIYELTNNISMYKNNGNIVIYGTPGDLGYIGDRYIERYEIQQDNLIIRDYSLEFNYLDLYGTEYIKNRPDNIKYWDPNITFIRTEKEFMFFHLGKQVGKTFTFPGETIKEYHYSYILDDQNNLYYMYYNIDENSPWVEFSKIDSNVTIPSVPNYSKTQVTMISKASELKIPIYFKNGKTYVGIPDFKTYKTYNSATQYKLDKNFTPNFKVQPFELSDENIEYVELSKIYDSIDINEFNWYLKYYYKYNDTFIYDEKRINGLDSYIGQNFIPKEKLDKLDGKRFSFSEKEKVIQELRDLYAEYQDYED